LSIWQLYQSLEIGFVLETMKRALAIRKPIILNSDQGSHFTSPKFINLMKENEVRISMDGKGRAKDNIVIQRFWHSVKYNEVYLNGYKSPRETRKGVRGYIYLHNHYLPHQSLQNFKPASVYNGEVILLSTCEKRRKSDPRIRLGYAPCGQLQNWKFLYPLPIQNEKARLSNLKENKYCALIHSLIIKNNCLDIL
jgi:hypothetical protein